MSSLRLVVGILVILAFLGLSAAPTVRGMLASRRRTRRMEGVANEMGMEFVGNDSPDTLSALPMPLFDSGDGALGGLARSIARLSARNVVRGHSPEERVFDLRGPEVASGPFAQVSIRQYRRLRGGKPGAPIWTCALISADRVLPALRVSRREIEVPTGADAVGGDIVSFESEEFNLAFIVRSPDRRFASAIVDARMMAWLLTLESPWSFETGGTWLLARHPAVAPESVPEVLAMAREFRERIPGVVWSLYAEERQEPLPVAEPKTEGA